MMQCVSRCPLPKRQHSTWPCLHVMVYTNASCCMVGECERVLWCGDVVSARGKREEAKTQTNKNKKDFSQNHFFPFSLFSSSFSSTLFSLPSTLPPSLPSYPYTHLFPCFTHGHIRGEPKTSMTQHLILFIVFSSCPNSLFLFFSFCG